MSMKLKRHIDDVIEALTDGFRKAGDGVSMKTRHMKDKNDEIHVKTNDLDNELTQSIEPTRRKRVAEERGIQNPTEGMTVYRVFGEAQDSVGGLQRGSRPFGESWTPVDPRQSSDFRWDAGLPDENPGRFVVEGILRRPSHVDNIRPALPLDGNPGGWPEYIIKDAHDAVEIRHVGGVNENWTNQPGDWTP